MPKGGGGLSSDVKGKQPNKGKKPAKRSSSKNSGRRGTRKTGK